MQIPNENLPRPQDLGKGVRVEVAIKTTLADGTVMEGTFDLVPETVTIVSKRELVYEWDEGHTEVKEMLPMPRSERFLIEGRVLNSKEGRP